MERGAADAVRQQQQQAVNDEEMSVSLSVLSLASGALGSLPSRSSFSRRSDRSKQSQNGTASQQAAVLHSATT